MSGRIRNASVLGVVLCLALVSAGCDDDDGGGWGRAHDTSSTSTTTTTLGNTTTTVSTSTTSVTVTSSTTTTTIGRRTDLRLCRHVRRDQHGHLRLAAV